MMKLIAIVLICIASTAFACRAYDGNTGVGYLTVCKPSGECFEVSSTRRNCINLIGGPFRKGNSGRNTYHCQVFSQQGCRGASYAVSSVRRNFPWQAMSYSCPWKC